jgi:hypothetical protein
MYRVFAKWRVTVAVSLYGGKATCKEKGVSHRGWYNANYKHVRAFMKENTIKKHVFITVGEAAKRLSAKILYFLV